MTPIYLLEALTEFVKEQTKDIILPVRVRKEGTEDKERAANVYKMALPKKEDQTQKAPYILLQVLNGMCAIRIVVVVYAESAEHGTYHVLNIISRLRSELEKAGVIGGKFTLQMPLEYIIYPDNIPPYFVGEMMTNWHGPTIQREVEELWQ